MNCGQEQNGGGTGNGWQCAPICCPFIIEQVTSGVLDHLFIIGDGLTEATLGEIKNRQLDNRIQILPAGSEAPLLLTARQLNELSDRQLLDIGVVRGDIAELAQEVARKAVANFNVQSETPKAARLPWRWRPRRAPKRDCSSPTIRQTGFSRTKS